MAMSQAIGEAQTAGGSGGDETVYELREYHLNEGKQELILARFRGKEREIFARYGMEGVGFWVPTDEPLKGKTLFYILRHPNREAATANWAAFHDDPEWKRVSAASEANGKLVEKSESTFLRLTDFSPKV